MLLLLLGFIIGLVVFPKRTERKPPLWHRLNEAIRFEINHERATYDPELELSEDGDLTYVDNELYDPRRGDFYTPLS